MHEVRLTHTAQLGAAERDALRLLLEAAFGKGEFGAHDWEHCLGGTHASVWEGDEPVAHGAVVQRRLLHGGRALRAGYVEGVGVRPDRRRRGLAGRVMAELERVVRGGYDLGALATSEDGEALYAARGWVRWRGPTSVLAPDGPRRTPEDDDCVHVLPHPDVPLDLDAPLTCDWRDGDVW